MAIPDDGVVLPIDLKPALQRSDSVTVYLGLPVLQSGRANVAGKDAPDGGALPDQYRDLGRREYRGILSRSRCAGTPPSTSSCFCPTRIRPVMRSCRLPG